MKGNGSYGLLKEGLRLRKAPLERRIETMDGNSMSGSNGHISPTIVMLRDGMDGIPEWRLPPGFSARRMTVAEIPAWREIWSDVEGEDKIGEGLFEKEMGFAMDEVARRCFIFCDREGNAAGTASAWFDRSFNGLDYGRIHWLAVKRAYQGSGLGKAMLSFSLNALKELGHERCYLVTQAFRIPAIKLYLSFGFRPSIGSKAELASWLLAGESLADPVLKAALDRAEATLEPGSGKETSNGGLAE